MNRKHERDRESRQRDAARLPKPGEKREQTIKEVQKKGGVSGVALEEKGSPGDLQQLQYHSLAARAGALLSI